MKLRKACRETKLWPTRRTMTNADIWFRPCLVSRRYDRQFCPSRRGWTDMILRPTTGVMSLFQQTGTEHLHRLNSGDVTSLELTQAYLNRIAAVDNRVGAFLSVDRERALAAAEDIDAR